MFCNKTIPCVILNEVKDFSSERSFVDAPQDDATRVILNEVKDL